MRQNIDIEKWDSNQTAVESKHSKMLCYSYARFSFITNLFFERKALPKELCVFYFSTNLFLGRKALPKEPCFLSTGSFFRKKVL